MKNQINTQGENPLNTLESGDQTVKSEVVDQPKKIATAVYMRVSTDEQELDRQKDGFKAWFKDKDATHRCVAIYQEKKSGGGGVVRKQMNKMMQDARAHKFSLVLFWDPSRLGRNTYENLQKIETLWACGVNCHFVDINKTYDRNDNESKLIIQMMMPLCEWERDTARKRSKEGTASKNKKLQEYAEKKGLPKMRVGNCSIIDVYVDDPYKREGKRGVAVQRSPEKAKYFEKIWLDPDVSNPYAILMDKLRNPINPKCKHSCDLSVQGRKEFDLTSHEKQQIDRAKMLGQNKCRCGTQVARKTIHLNRERLGLPVRNEHSFKRKEEGLDFDDLTFDFMTPSHLSHFPCGKRRPIQGGYRSRIDGKIRIKGGEA